MQPQQPNRKLLIVGSALALIVLLILIISFSAGHHKAKIANAPGTGQTTTFNDPVSHETIVTQKGKAPETNGSTTQAPLFAGFDKLIDQGITIQQLDALEQALGSYQPFASGSPQISLAVDDIQLVSPDTSGDSQARWSIKSHIVVNQKTTYQIQFYYSGVGAVQLYIYNADGSSQLYDSGVIDTTAADGESSPDT